MRKIFLLLSTISISSYAQDLSIHQALELAQNSKLRQSEVNFEIQNQNLIIQRRKLLPLIYGEGNVQRNIIIPVTPVPSIAFDPNANPGEMTALRFATDWSSKAGIQMSWDIYNPQNKLNIKEAENQLKLAEVDKEIEAQNLKATIIDLYAQGILAQKQLDESLLLQDNFEVTFLIINERYLAGRTSLIELNDAKQKKVELELAVFEAEMVLKQKYLLLNQYINMDNYSQLSSSIDSLDQLFTNDELDFKKKQLEINLYDVKLANLKLEYLPKITFNAYYGSQYFNNEFRVFNSNNWYGNSYVNVSLRVPITESFDIKSKRNLLTFQQQLAKEKLSEIDLNIKNDELVNVLELSVIKQKIEAQKEIIILAKNNLEIVQEQVKEGRVLITELNAQLENVVNKYKQLWQLEYDYVRKNLD